MWLRKSFCTAKFSLFPFHPVLKAEFVRRTLFSGGRDKLSDITVLDTEMKNKISYEESSKMMLKMFYTT